MRHQRSLLSAHQLSLGYDVRRPLVSNLSLELWPGEVVFLLGRNGSGKTTLLRTLAGLLGPLSGEIRYGDRLLAELSGAERAKRRAVLFPWGEVSSPVQVREVVALGRLPYADWSGRLSSADEEAARRAMRDVGCLDWSDRWVSELSDGEKQRVFLARVLAQGTEVLLLDEPTAFIDLPQRIEIAKVLKRWAREAGRGVVLSTHDLDLAMATADRIWMLESGGVWTSGIPEELVMSGSLGRVFESNDATIDRSSGRLVWCLPGGRPIAVSGDGPWLDWTIRALVRSGYRIDSKSVARVEVRLAGGQTSWEARKEEASIQAASLGELLAALRESYPAEENVSG